MNNHDKILILDFGSQLTQLIARRVRELNIYSEIRPFSISDKEINNFNPKAIILSGGSESVTDFDSPKIPKVIYELNVPILGVCYGQQAICKDFGGTVSSSTSRSYGAAQLEILEKSMLFDNYWQPKNNYQVWMSHGDCISKLPNDFKVIAKTDKAPYAAIEHKTKNIFGIQFHPEVSHTLDGIKLIDTFLTKIVGCKKDWEMGCFIDEAINQIKNSVGKQKVALGLSGGIDSTVVATLLNKAIGKQLYCIFVNNGLLRHNEVEEVEKSLKDNFDLQIITIDAQKKFLSELKGVTDPEEKRKIIGRVFIETFQSAIKDIGDIRYLAQGTIYPDVIESAATSTGKKVTIKSHHNVGGLPKDMGNLKLIEPLRLLFKDEVRKLGKELGVPSLILNRHPFPGPGLGIRVIGEVTEEKCEILRKADYIFINTLKENGLYDKIWQAYVALLPVKTVGVMGDARTYQHICVLRAVTSVDGMTADYVDLPHSILGHVARKIVNEVQGINRVVYDVTSKPPATIEME
ncbi:glutamine-hydrolyzing GMP synthase [Candidatus Bandiella numerosa]|uniref:glutamine-hydrolyzing GMP synthase n=1 Tax=Candidatus Bandiella numerosa TaxID=2570586 RepID=UPI001F030CD7|nr:glutamine-hydrolyzing GMP synthase [Candidatus Bandiella numerosa]